MEEQWSSFTSLLKDSCGDKSHEVTLRSQGSIQICDLTTKGHWISLRYAGFQPDMTDEGLSQALDGCFRACADGLTIFLLLIQGGLYTKSQTRMIEILQTRFGAEALEYLIVLSMDDGKVVEVLDDALLDLIKECNGRYCRVTSSASDGLHALVKIVDDMLSENGMAGYTETMLAAARKRSSEDSAMDMLTQKLQQALQKEQAFKQLAEQREGRRGRALQELKAKHAEERDKEAAEKNHYEAKRQSLEEALKSHKAMLELQMTSPHATETQKTSVIMLGLSGSGKSSALSLILQRAGKQYSVHRSGPEQARSTMCCERKEVFAAGRRLILVDTPELWDEDGVENVELVKDCLALALPGPHVFLLVLQVGRFTQGECEMLGHLQRIFGREVAEHAVILLVQFDCNRHRPQRINDYVAAAHSTLQDLIRKCGSRYYELNITKSQNALSYPQVKDLLLGINKLVASHGGVSYSGRRFTPQELQERSKEIEERKGGGQEGNYLLRKD